MSTDGERALERNLREIRELVERIHASPTRYIQIDVPRRYNRPDLIIHDDIESGDEVRRQAGVNAEPRYSPWATVYTLGTTTGRNWASEVNARIAQDRELVAERYAAYRRAEAAEEELNDQYDAEWVEVERRIERGKQIPERPVRFSWLHGPEEG